MVSFNFLSTIKNIFSELNKSQGVLKNGTNNNPFQFLNNIKFSNPIKNQGGSQNGTNNFFQFLSIITISNPIKKQRRFSKWDNIKSIQLSINNKDSKAN